MRTRLCALFVLVAAASLAAQDSAPQRDAAQPTFRSGANYIRVDMYATTDGKPVTDLRPEEVEVFEDGVLQKIEAFEHVRVPLAASSDTRPEVDGVRASREAAADARARVFVVFLDTYHTQAEGSVMMRKPLVNFLNRILGPDDLVALMTPEMGASDISFGRNTTVIENLLSEEWWGRRARVASNDPQEFLYESCALEAGLDAKTTEELKARRREKLTFDAIQDLVIHLNGIREERKAVLVVTEGWMLYGRNDALMKGTGPQPRILVPAGPQGRQPLPTTPAQFDCEADRMRLGALDHEHKIREIGEDANRGNVTFYPVFARGLAVFDAPIGPDMPPAPIEDAANLRRRQVPMRDLAVDTDGEAVINTNLIDQALKRIADDLSSYYLLGYYTTNTKLDGRFRSISVRVKRPGVRVRARRGYRGRTAEDLLTRVGPAPNPAMDAVTSAINRMTATNARSTFRIRPAAWARAGAGGVAGTAWVVGELDFRTRKELPWTAGVQAEVVVLSSDGAQVSASTTTVPASQGAFGMRVPDAGTLAPGEYAVRVRLRSEADTDLVLTDTLRLIMPPGATALGEAVLWRRGPTTGQRHLQTADSRFQRSDRIRLEHPAAGEGTPVGRMLDRLGNPMFVPVQVTERPDPSGEFRWIVADATLAPLTNGDYAIEVTLGDTKQVTAFRVVP